MPLYEDVGLAGVNVEKKHIPGPQGVRGRNSDNSRLRDVLNWEPEISREKGLTQTYQWIEKQVEDFIEAEGLSAIDNLAHSKVVTTKSSTTSSSRIIAATLCQLARVNAIKTN